jgi:hypothetical protein
MSLIEQFPQIGSGGGGGSWNGGTVTAQATFQAEVDLDANVTIASTSIALNGGAQTIGATTALVRVTGSTASSTIDLPASPISGQVIWIDSQASVSYTLSGNGNNLDGAASKTVATTGPICLWFTGSAWESLAWPQYLLDARYPTLAGSNTFSSQCNFGTIAPTTVQSTNIQNSSKFILGSQSLSASGTVGNAAIVLFTGSTAGQTLTLPASPTLQQMWSILNTSSVAVTLAPNSGQTLNLTNNNAGTLGVTTGSISIPAGGRVDVIYGATNEWYAH